MPTGMRGSAPEGAQGLKTRIEEISGVFRKKIPKLLKREQVIESWNTLIKDGDGNAERVFGEIQRYLEESKAPIKFERRGIIPGILKGLIGESRDFIIVRSMGYRLKPYQVFINARDYGKNLQVSWYLTYRLPILRALIYSLPFMRIGASFLEDLDVFNLMDLRAFALLCHLSAINAVENLMISLGQDTSKLNRRTKGFLGIA